MTLWEKVSEHKRRKTRYNISRVYNPDGTTLATCPKVHSCEWGFQHGYSLCEFDICSVPTTLHICHDTRYPELWTLPVMFGARLILHPANGGFKKMSIDAFEERTRSATTTSHAFYLRVNGGGGSYLAGPYRSEKALAVSVECKRENPDFPTRGVVREGLFDKKISVQDAFGYWPARSFRASEAVAESYVRLYRSLGGRRFQD